MNKILKPEGVKDGLMFIGINPSIYSGLKSVWEDPYGQYFSYYLRLAKIDPLKIWVTNLYKKSTPDNRPLNKKELKEARTIWEEIKEVNPKLIVALGTQVMDFFQISDKDSIQKIGKYRFIGIYHPSYVHRQENYGNFKILHRYVKILELCAASI